MYGSWQVSNWPATRTKEEALYLLLGEAIRQGIINRMRVCPECGRYLFVSDLKQRFCDSSCKDDYNNRLKLEGKKFQEYRKLRRQRLLARVRRLRASGKTLEEIHEVTKKNLPFRVLKRTFNLPSIGQS